MNCGRCQGLMLVDHFLDLGAHAGHRWLQAWRCLNCGEVVEPGLATQRRAQRSRLIGLVERLRAKKAYRPYERVPLGI